MGVDQPRDDLKDSREIMLPLPVKGFQLNFVNFAYKGICVMFTKRACQPSCPRSPSNPEGDVSKPAVANANCMVARSALVLGFAQAGGSGAKLAAAIAREQASHAAGVATKQANLAAAAAAFGAAAVAFA